MDSPSQQPNRTSPENSRTSLANFYKPKILPGLSIVHDAIKMRLAKVVGISGLRIHEPITWHRLYDEAVDEFWMRYYNFIDKKAGSEVKPVLISERTHTLIDRCLDGLADFLDYIHWPAKSAPPAPDLIKLENQVTRMRLQSALGSAEKALHGIDVRNIFDALRRVHSKNGVHGTEEYIQAHRTEAAIVEAYYRRRLLKKLLQTGSIDIDKECASIINGEKYYRVVPSVYARVCREIKALTQRA